MLFNLFQIGLRAQDLTHHVALFGREFLLVFDVDDDLVVPWKMLIDASNPASNSPGSARVSMNVMCSFVMLAMSSMPSHISTTSPHFSAATSA